MNSVQTVERNIDVNFNDVHIRIANYAMYTNVYNQNIKFIIISRASH